MLRLNSAEGLDPMFNRYKPQFPYKKAPVGSISLGCRQKEMSKQLCPRQPVARKSIWGGGCAYCAEYCVGAYPSSQECVWHWEGISGWRVNYGDSRREEESDHFLNRFRDVARKGIGTSSEGPY